MNVLMLAYVAVGGAMGSMSRYCIQSFFPRTGDFPFGTFAVNIFGSFLLGAWLAVIVYLLPAKSRDLHMLVAVGFLGGFTTFSAFTLESYLLLEKGLLAQGIAYISGSVLLSLGAFFVGMWIVKAMTV